MLMLVVAFCLYLLAQVSDFQMPISQRLITALNIQPNFLLEAPVSCSYYRVMRRIFLLYMPPGNREAMVHYEDTIRKRVVQERIFHFVNRDMQAKLRSIFGQRPIAVWGSRSGPLNRSKFESMEEGDEVLIVEGSEIKLLGRVAAKTENPDLAHELWKPLAVGSEDLPWALIYFIANPQEINLPFTSFRSLFGYSEGYQLRGFSSVSEERLAAFYAQYDDLYSVLMREKMGEPLMAKSPAVLMEAPDLRGSVPDEGAAGAAPSPILESEHLEMQYRLLRMGKNAGEKVWAPRSDQTRITSKYQFKDFETTFAAGLDTQVKYVENIDVVWKDQFRIDAAFEIENSTAIYSGLLRFSDLTMVAPNTLYPLFIVAPCERRNRVKEQLSRPTFSKLQIASKVRYLSYEKLREIDDFFGSDGGGINVNVLKAKSESLIA